MKKVFGFLGLSLAVFILSACGATVTEVPEATVELEVQIVTSEPDSVSVRYVEVENSRGEVVASARNSINRLVRFELPRGDYVVSAEIAGYKGSVGMRRDVMLAGDTNTLLDLTDETFYGYYEDYLDTGVSKSSHFVVREGESRFDESIVLYLESVVLESNYAIGQELMTVHGLTVASNQFLTWVFTPAEDRVINASSISVDVDFEVNRCTTFLGSYQVSWYGEGMSKTQELINTPLCTKG